MMRGLPRERRIVVRRRRFVSLLALLGPALLVASVEAQNLNQIHYRWRNDYGREVGIPNGTMQVSGTTSITTNSNTYTPVSQMLMSPGVAGDFLVFFTATTEATSDDSIQRVSIFVDGAQVTHSEREILTETSIPDTPFNVVTHAFLPGLTAGQVVSVQWLTSSGTVAMRGRTLTITQVTGADVTQVTATSNTTTSSATDVLANSMTMTPGAGDYLVWFSTSVKGNNDDVETYVSLYRNGVQVPHTERLVDQEESLAGDAYFPVGTHALLTGVGAGEVIEARWRRSPSDSSTMLERTLTAYRINPADAFEASDTLDTTTTSTVFNQVSNMALTPGAGNYHVWFTGTLEGTSDDQVMEVALYVNGVQVPHTLRDFLVEPSYTDTFQSQPVAFQAFVTGVGAADVIDVRWRRTNGGTATMHERTLVAWRDTPGAPQAWWTTAEDTKLTGVVKGTTQRIRLEVAKASGAGVTATYQLRVSEGANCAAGTYTAVPTGAGGHWRVVDSIWITNGEPTQNITPGLTDEAATFVPGQLMDASNTTGSITLNANRFTEIEFAIQATTNAVDGQDYCFQLYDATSGSVLSTYSVYGQAQLAGGTLFLANHDAGQRPDKFTTTTPVTSELFGFKLTAIGTVTVDNVRILFSTGGGVANGDVTSGELWLDANNDGVINGGDSMIQGGISGAAGRLTFTTNFVPPISGSNYLVRATVANLVSDDTTTFDLGLGEIDELSPVTESGSVTGATHTQDKMLTLANHTVGQIGDQFTVPSPITTAVFRFHLTRGGIVTVDTLRVNFTTGGGVANGDVSAGELWLDANNDGVINGGDSSIQTAVTPVGGVLTFTNNFQPSIAGTNYLIRVTVANLVADDTTTFTLGLTDIDPVEASVLEAGSTTGATHTQGKTLALANHDAGQTTDKFLTTTPVTDVLYGFKLSGTVTIDTLRLNFGTALGVINGDVTSGELWIDANNDGVINGGDSSIQTGVTPAGGVLTFTTNFFSGVRNYLVRATVANLAGGDTTTFSMGTADIDEVEVGVGESGSATDAVHLHDGVGGVKDVYYSVGTSAADLKTGAPTISITGGTATLSVAQTGNVGIGDFITYGGNNVYVHRVTSPTEFEVRTVTGTFPANAGPTLITFIGRRFNSWQGAVNNSGTGPFLGTFDLTAANARVTWVGYNDGPFNAEVVVDGYTTDATRYLRLSVAGPGQVASDVSQRHDGTAGSGVVIRAQANGSSAISIRDSYTRVEWLELDGSARGPASNNVGIDVNATGNNALLQGLLIHHESSGDSSAHGILVNGNATEVRNCVIYEVDDGINTSGTGVALKSSTIYAANGDGIQVSGGTATAENVIAMASGIDFFENGGTFTLVDYCMSDNGTADDFGGTGNLVFIAPVNQFVSITPGAEDLHLKTGADALDTGKDLSASFSFDIDGGARSAPWDMGADDLLATTAVELIAFGAVPRDGAVELTWETGSEVGNLGFYLYRAPSAKGPYVRVTANVIPGLGNSPVGARYQHLDGGLANGTTYYYELEDIETTGATKRHGPVSATPFVGAPSSEEANEDESEDARTRIVYGNPNANRLQVLDRSRYVVLLELVTEGFYAIVGEDGTVSLEIPGFESLTEGGAPSLPVAHHWVEAVAGRKVELEAIRAGLEPVTTAWQVTSESPELRAKTTGTVRAERRRRLRGSTTKGMFPTEPARLLTVGYQGESKRALVELAPVRWNAESGQLYLSRRLLVRLSFHEVDPAERSLADNRGRRRARKIESSQGVLARLATRERGLYGVRYEEVLGKGGALPVDSLRLSRRGADVAFHVEPAGGHFSRGSMLYFLSEGGDANPYGREAVYELQLSPHAREGKRMDTAAAPASGMVTSFYWKREEQERNRYYQAALLEAPDHWLWDVLIAPQTTSYSIEVSALADTLVPSTLDVYLQGTSDTPAALDHHVRVFLNRTLLTESSWGGKTAKYLTAEIGPGVLVEGENLLELENVGDTGASYSMVMLDRFALRYPRRPVAEHGELEGTWSESGTATISGVSANAHVLELGESPRWLAGGSKFRVEAGKSYGVFDPSAVRSPEIRRPMATVLASKDNRADYVLIGPRAFVEAAAPLLDHRSAQGLVPKGVALEDIVSEFGHGEFSPEAIRTFLEHAYHEWRAPSLRYVLILGDGSYDYKDYAELGRDNPVPPLMVQTSYLWTASDPALAAVNGDDLLPDVAIGRLPAATVEEVRALVGKILSWESSGFGMEGPAVLVADDPDRAGDFVADAEAAALRLPPGTPVSRIYSSELGASATRSAVIGAFDGGASLVTYIGHGGIHLWADENFFNTGDVNALAPQPRQPVLLTMNCLNGYFHFPHFNSMAEELLKAEGKGAIAAFSPSGLSLNAPAQKLHRALLDELYSNDNLRLGDAVLRAQRRYLDTGAFPELLSIYHLFGDPALKLR
jgi:hypothetical protein